MAKKEVDNLRTLADWFRQKEERAKQLRSAIPNHAKLFFGLSGANYQGNDFEIVPEFISFRRVDNPPGIVHVCRAADLSKTDYLGVARYSLQIRSEIAIGTNESWKEPLIYDMAWNVAALLKLRGHNLITCPVSANNSWDTISALSDNSVEFKILDDVPKQIDVRPRKVKISNEDVQWIKKYLSNSIDLRNAIHSKRFGLAYNIAYSWNHTLDSRIALANIWAGLEALFGVQNDRPVTRKLAERIQHWLPNELTVDEIISLYNFRCDAVHGRNMNKARLGEALYLCILLLQRSLVKCIECNEKTLPDWNG